VTAYRGSADKAGCLLRDAGRWIHWVQNQVQHEQLSTRMVDIKGIVFIFRTIPLELAVRDVSYYSRLQTKNSVLQTRETAPGKDYSEIYGKRK
jgi:hypothetical protein